MPAIWGSAHSTTTEDDVQWTTGTTQPATQFVNIAAALLKILQVLLVAEGYDVNPTVSRAQLFRVKYSTDSPTVM